MASQLLAGARSAAQAPQPLCSTSAAPVRLGIASQQRQRRGRRAAASTGAAAAVGEAAATQLALPRSSDPNAAARVGSFEAPLVEAQASKVDPEQPTLASVLPPFDPSSVADVAIVGAGPAGLALAAELATQGVSVALISTESKFVNNYGVWLDEFKDLGLEHTLDAVWDDAVCFFKEAQMTRVGRPYGRVCRRRLRAHLLERCAAAGVQFLEAEVADTSCSGDSQSAELHLTDGRTLRCRMPLLASGVAAGRLLRYEDGVPPMAAQTAYGIEAEVEGYEGAYPEDAMLFMDFRRHHTGLYDGTATRQQPGKSQHGFDGLAGTEGEVPSFLYAMPLGGKRVFLEETCLVARPALPFNTLKRRLERRCKALGIQVKEVHEEEWSYIPVGGPLPLPDQQAAAFGAAACLVHPATGYSITRSLREAPDVARAIKVALQEQPSSLAAVRFVWEALWTQERRRQTSFQVFGMELLCQLDSRATSDFFTTFFKLPASYWRGFLASKLSSVDLLSFAMLTFVLAPPNIKAKLVTHFMTDTSGRYMISTYTGKNREQWEEPASSKSAATQLPAAAAGLLALQQLAAAAVERARPPFINTPNA
ncbi:lycopene epsilon chloroplastic [Micractinium conductrix]|uniref:Lycopene epsilon chloroplastic n=1 Tax=Micractinium conductrix TaxID=554055 RepID=A0A2P6V4M9_9CHLO|nr:lycopene epsilon chloroplastic [Micractinium conductrix]|eukprot:PSC69034.1 lycopene epsilon chloroplastic [Micractinium conductrix]